MLVEIFKRIVADDIVGVVLSLAAGYIAYLPAEELGVSGVLAAVDGRPDRRAPLAASSRPPASRLRGYAFWEVLVFLLNATLFVLVGLQLPAILDEQERSAAELVGARRCSSALVVIGARLAVGVHGAVRHPRARPAPVAGGAPHGLALADDRGLERPARRGLARRRAGAAARLPRARPADLPHAVRDLRDARRPGAHAAVADPAARRPRRRQRRARGAARAARGDRGGDRPPASGSASEEWTRDDTVERMLALYRFRDRRLRQRAGELDDDEEADDLDERSHATSGWSARCSTPSARRVVELRDEGAISDDVLHTLERELDLEDQRLEI